MLRDLTYKGVYKSDCDNILQDFYFPTLSIANRYDRAVGFFSASSISHASQALSHFVNNGGKIRLILGAFSDPADLEAVKEGYRKKEISDKIGEELVSMISETADEVFQNRLETLAWLVMHGRLDIKIALRERGMYHDKVGIITDGSDDKVVFSGSANESAHALLPTFNYESISVFRTWEPAEARWFEEHINSFERLWQNQAPSTAVIDIPTALEEKLNLVARSLEYLPAPEIEQSIIDRYYPSDNSTTPAKPTLPGTLGGEPFQPLDHQREALNRWNNEGDFCGIFDLATGAGKTITAIYGMVKLCEERKLVCIIAVPYINLADQWVEVLELFKVYPVRCYGSKSKWEKTLNDWVHQSIIGAREFLAIVVVNKTLQSSAFQSVLKRINGEELLWIGDECHWHTSENFNKFLPSGENGLPSARYRMGLSATPEHYIDTDKNLRLNQFYGNIVHTYTLKQAIKDKVLTPYSYHPNLVELTDEEAEEFIVLSDQIGQLLSRDKVKSEDMSSHLKQLLMKRARIIGSATNKLPMLRNLLNSQKPKKHTLFYCGDGSNEGQRQIEAVSELLYGIGWNLSRFTSRENKGIRAKILENFRGGIIDAMVAIKCLDEGIDVPACDAAYILASSQNPREFIQRRGRILRRAPGKERAVIHDFIVILPEDYLERTNYAKNQIKNELKRVAEFSALSENRPETYGTLAPVLRKYDLEHMI